VFQKSDLASAVVGGFSAVAGVKVFGLGLAFLSHVVLARATSVENYGIYIYVWGWITVLAYVGRAGFDNLLERYLSKYRTQKRWAELRGAFRRALQYVGGFSVLIGCAGAVVVWLLGARVSSSMRLTFWYGFALLPILTGLHVTQSGLRGLKLVGRSFVPELIVRHTVLIAVCGLLWFLIGPFEAWEIMGLTAVAFVLAVSVAAVMFWRALPQEARSARADYGNRNWLKKALPFAIFAGTGLLQSKADILMLGMLAEPRDVGIYGVVLRLTAVIGLTLTIVNRTVRPYFSEMYTDDEPEKLQWLVSLCILVVSPITILVSSVLIFFGPQLLSLFGTEYVVGYGILLIILGGRIVAALAGPVGVFMIMTDQEGVASRIEGAAAFANVVLNGVLIPYFGVEGAAIATATTLAARNIAFAYIVWTRHGINATVLNPGIFTAIKKMPA